MKKLSMTLVAFLMITSSAYADGGGSSRANSSSLTIGEFFCALAGGTAVGAVVKQAGGGNPVTFIGALVGGVIGYQFCKYLSNPEAQGLQEAAWQGLNSCGSQTSWQGREYYGTLQVLAQGYKVNGGSGEGSTENICKYFETTIYQIGSRKKVATSKAWACKNENNQWNVTPDNWVIRENLVTCNNTPIQNGGGAVTIVQPNVPVAPIKNPRWDASVLTRLTDDRGVIRNFSIARRICTKRVEDDTNRCVESWSEPGLGDFKAILSDNRNALLVFESVNRPSVLTFLDEIAVKCRDTGACAEVEVQTTDGLSGEQLYIFQNGDVVINDLNKGVQVRPESSIVSSSNTAPKLN